MERQENQKHESVDTGWNNPSLTFLNLDQKKRNKRWTFLQDFFESNSHDSSLGEKTEIFLFSSLKTFLTAFV